MHEFWNFMRANFPFNYRVDFASKSQQGHFKMRKWSPFCKWVKEKDLGFEVELQPPYGSRRRVTGKQVSPVCFCLP